MTTPEKFTRAPLGTKRFGGRSSRPRYDAQVTNPNVKTRKRVSFAPIKIPRWALLLKYIGFTVFGVIANGSGAPSLDLATPEGYRPIWSSFIVCFAAAAFIACLFGGERVSRGTPTRGEHFERWFVLGLISFCSAYVYAIGARALGGDQDVQALAVMMFLVMLLPIARFLTLLPRSRRE